VVLSSKAFAKILLCQVFLILFTAALFFSCSLLPDPRPSDRVVIATWNVENLFDEVHEGGEYPEFDPRRTWTQGQFWARCDRLARVIHALDSPDILVLQEIEGVHAAEVLNTRFLGDLGYRHTVMAPESVPGVKTVILSRWAPVRTGLLFPGGGSSESLRPVVEAEFDLGGRALVVLANHWKSRIPSAAATEGARRDAARVNAHRIAELEARRDHPVVVALGDFNTSLDQSRPFPDPALVPGSRGDEDSGLVVWSTRRSALGSRVPGAVWDPWETQTDPPGSYFYHGDWTKLDHIFVAASSLKATDWAVTRFRAVAYAPKPLPYSPASPQGVSDHFPLVLTLERPLP